MEESYKIPSYPETYGSAYQQGDSLEDISAGEIQSLPVILPSSRNLNIIEEPLQFYEEPPYGDTQQYATSPPTSDYLPVYDAAAAKMLNYGGEARPTEDRPYRNFGSNGLVEKYPMTSQYIPVNSSELPGLLKQKPLSAMPGLKNYLSGTEVELNRPGDVLVKPVAPESPQQRRERIAQAAARRLDASFARTIAPLAEALRGEPKYAEPMARVLFGKPSRYLISKEVLGQQRPLTTVEEAQIETIAPLSRANSYIVAAGRVAPEITRVCMDAHWARLTAATRKKYPSGSYAKVLVMGAGVHGTIVASEIASKRPDLVADTVYVDKNKGPMGPFRAPNGKGWNLNSGAPVGDLDFALSTEATPTAEAAGIRRSGGGVLRWFPGERDPNDPLGPRRGSINRLGEYFPGPDALKDVRYIDNTVMELEGSMEDALTMENTLFETDVISIMEDEDAVFGKYRVLMEDTYPDGSRLGRILYVDNIISAGGKPQPNIAFDEKSSAFQEILAAQQDKPGLPYYTNGLDLYAYAADRSKNEPLEHGSRFVLLGDGNTAETQLELLAGLVESGRIDVKRITSITVVGPRATEKIGCRPRYKQVLDLLNRAGRGNVLQLVDARPDDVVVNRDFNDPDKITGLVPAQDGFILTSPAGRPVVGDHIIDSTGFKNDLDTIFEPLLRQSKFSRVASSLVSIRVGQELLNVGERWLGRPEIAFFGTGINPRIEGIKRQVLPPGSRDVLEQVGENVAAIGFIGADTQAGTGAYLADLSNTLPPLNLSRVETSSITDEPLSTANDIPAKASNKQAIPESSAPMDWSQDPSPALLTPLLLIPLASRRMTSKQFNRTLHFEVKPDGQNFEITSAGNAPTEVLLATGDAAADPTFFAWAKRALAETRGAEKIAITMHYKNGRLDLRRSLVRAV